MAKQEDNSQHSDAPPKLQQLPGRAGNKLQGRLYKNAGRGYDRESLQKMSAGGGRSLVTSEEQQASSSESIEPNVNSTQTIVDTAQGESNSITEVKHYIAGAVLFLAGIVIGNVVIPLFTASDQIVESTPARSDAGTDTEITGITSITGAEEEKGCSITSLSNDDDLKGCSIDAANAGATSNTLSPK